MEGGGGSFFIGALTNVFPFPSLVQLFRENGESE